MYNKILEYSDNMIIETQKASVLLNYVLERESNPPEVFVPLSYIKKSLCNIDEKNLSIQNIITNNLL